MVMLWWYGAVTGVTWCVCVVVCDIVAVWCVLYDGVVVAMCVDVVVVVCGA